MHKVELDQFPTAPVIPSQLSAQERTLNWFQANDFRHMQDQDGQLWQVLMKRSEKPNPDNIHQLIWSASIQLCLVANAHELLSHGVLDKENDQRIIELLGDQNISMSMKPKLVTGKNQDLLKREVNEYLPRLKEGFKLMDIYPIKRVLVFEWVERQSWFREL